MTAHHRGVTRTFKPRRRGLTPGQSERFARLASGYVLPVDGVPVDGGPVDWSELFGTSGDVVLDIGFGWGAALVELAIERPTELVVGIDVHTPGVAWVLDAIERHDLANVRLVHDDALDFLHRVPAASVAVIRVWFPDPWPKVRQRHRRLIKPEVVAAFADRLRVGGVLHLATDIADYALQMQHVCDAEPGLRGGVVQRPGWRPETPFERKGADAGRVVVDLIYERHLS